MDKLVRYREVVHRLIEEYARYKPAHGQIETEAVVDADRDHYEVLHVGWDGVQPRPRSGSPSRHQRRQGLGPVRRDIARPIAEELVAAGLRTSCRHSPAELRPLTGFGVS